MPKMILTGGSGGGDFEMTPEGFFTARCYRMLDLGTQPVQVKGETKFKHQITIGWEIIGKNDPRMTEGDNAGKPFTLHSTYTASLHEKSNLYAALKTWRGKGLTEEEALGFDIFDMLGQYCMIQVIHNKVGDKTYANIGAIVPSAEHPDPVNEDVAFIISDPDMEVFEGLSDKMKAKIQAAPEWKGAKSTPLDKVAPVDTDKEITAEDLGAEDDPIDPNDIPF